MVLRRLPWLLLVLVSCASASRAREHLDLASRGLYDALQFGDYQNVANQLDPALRAEFLSRAFGAEKSLKVLEFMPVGATMAEDEKAARLVTRISWYELPSTKVKTESVFIDWKRIEDVWVIVRIIGGPLPVPDPESVVPSGPPPAPAPVAPGAAPAATPPPGPTRTP